MLQEKDAVKKERHAVEKNAKKNVTEDKREDVKDLHGHLRERQVYLS